MTMDRSVLIVEDDKAVSRAIQTALAPLGYQIRAACNCSNGLALAQEAMPRLLVLDLALPDGSGLSLLQDIRRSFPQDDPGVVVVSSNPVTRAELRAHNVHRFVPKPFDMAYLVETIQELLPPHV